MRRKLKREDRKKNNSEIWQTKHVNIQNGKRILLAVATRAFIVNFIGSSYEKKNGKNKNTTNGIENENARGDFNYVCYYHL